MNSTRWLPLILWPICFPVLKWTLQRMERQPLKKQLRTITALSLWTYSFRTLMGSKSNVSYAATLKLPKKNIRICAMTASVTKERVDECFESGMNDYMMKPFNPETLKEKVLRNALAVD